MTKQKSFKRLVRARMAETGETYTAARAVLLGAGKPESSSAVPASVPAVNPAERPLAVAKEVAKR